MDSQDKDFISPTGIIKSNEDGEFEYELIKEGFIALHDKDNNSFDFELVVGKDKLLETFIKTLKFIPSPDRIEVCIKGHWHNQKSELWAIDTSKLPTSIEYFLLENKENILRNGFVECAVTLNSDTIILTLNEHKKIFFQTQDEKLFISFGEAIMALGFKQTKELYNLEYGFYHWHYRPAQSLDAPELRTLLLDTGFRFVQSWDEEPSERYPDDN
ncbi:hypothetical protein A0257_03080 [Hymenobacter psoromatis]|nr:hypothetical protein A0257_03080 [Hymenobacter psoromatis]